MSHFVPLAFGFANLALLGWLAAAAAPLLIHLWMRRVRKETRWAAVRFLQAAIKRHARRLQLQQWILLGIRTAILLLVVLAAMKPLVDSLGAVGAGVRTHRLIVIDASLSMGAESTDGRLIDRAKQLAAQLVDQSNSGDVFSVYMLAAPPQAALAQPTSDRARTKRAIGEIKLTDGRADLAQGLALVQSALTEAESTGIRVDRHEAVFFTDLTASTWGALADASDDQGASQEARQLYAKLIDEAELAVISVGADDTENNAVTDLRIEQSAVTTQQPVAVRAQLRRFGEGDQETTVDLVIDNLTTDTKQVTLSAGADATVEFAHQFHSPGVHQVSVRIVDDTLPGDNRRFAAAQVADRLRVLCVEGRRGAARYIARALNPSGQADTAIEPVIVSDAELSTIDFAQYRCVFFCNVAQLSRNEADRLRGYLQRGGGVVFFLGDQVAPERYNEILGRWKAEGGRRKSHSQSAIRNPNSAFPLTPVLLQNEPNALESLLPVSIGPVLSDPQYRLDPLEYRHPITAPFKGRERAGLITTPISHYYKLSSIESSGAQVALATTGGDPLIVTAQKGRGRVAVVATDGSLTSVDPATGEPWTVMPAWPSFLPIVRGLLEFSLGASDQGQQLVGQAIGAPLPESAPMDQLVVRRPRGDEEPASVLSTDEGEAWRYARTDQAGVYQLAVAANPTPVDAVAVNPDPRESDLARVRAGQLPAEIRLRGVDADDSSRGAELVEPTGVHRTLLAAALVLVLVETFLAYWFGRSTA